MSTLLKLQRAPFFILIKEGKLIFMASNYSLALNRNIYKYYAHRILAKRAYLPLIAVYAVNVAKVSLFELGAIAAITATVQFLLEIPSGYISDKVGHKRALVFGSIIISVSPMAYILWPNFTGIMLGSVIFFAGVSFHSGTMEAFVHETLLELKREKETAKIMGLSQTIGLAGNVAMVSLVPLTYMVDVRLPFAIGGVILLADLVLMLTFTTPLKTHKSVQELEHVSFTRLIRALHGSKHHLIFILLGVATAVSHMVPEFRELLFQEIGVPTVLFGFILGASSLVGVVFSYNIHKLHRVLPAKKFYLFDLLTLTILTIFIGLATNPVVGVILFVLFTAYSRSRRIPIQAYLLADSPTRKLKATYLSLLTFFSSLNIIWVPLFLGYMIGELGINRGYTAFGIITLVLLLGLYGIYNRGLRQPDST